MMVYCFSSKLLNCIFLLSFIASFTNCRTLMEQRLQIVERTNIEVEKTLEDKVTSLGSKVARLEEKVQQQEARLLNLVAERQAVRKYLSKSVDNHHDLPKNVFHRTCYEARAANSSLISGMHWIDPDGQGTGDDPIHVYCNMTTGSTSILHDSESDMTVESCADRGCYSRKINYYASNRQIAALTELSVECHQSIKYDCIGVPFNFNGAAFSWWNDKNGNPQYFWSGNNASFRTCQCAIDQNCFERFLSCNCDSLLHTKLTDSGIITTKNLLPVTRLNFGRTHLTSSSGIHTLGRLECSGQIFVKGMPKSCTDLWRMGHVLSGLYSVMGSKKVESVYCDFTKLPDKSGFQTWIGYIDVKSLSVYFYVHKSSNFGVKNVPIPFEVEKLNVGGAMNKTSGIFTVPRTGIYFFSFSAISVGGNSYNNLYIGLYVNGSRIGLGHSQNVHDTLTLQSTLQLNAGDKVSVQIYNGSGSLHDDTSRYTHFTGWLLQEDLAF